MASTRLTSFSVRTPLLDGLTPNKMIKAPRPANLVPVLARLRGGPVPEALSQLRSSREAPRPAKKTARFLTPDTIILDRLQGGFIKHSPAGLVSLGRAEDELAGEKQSRKAPASDLVLKSPLVVRQHLLCIITWLERGELRIFDRTRRSNLPNVSARGSAVKLRRRA